MRKISLLASFLLTTFITACQVQATAVTADKVVGKPLVEAQLVERPFNGGYIPGYFAGVCLLAAVIVITLIWQKFDQEDNR